MGRLDIDPSIYHFSHPQHALKPLNIQSQSTKNVICAGCKLKGSGWMYYCAACNFFLHKTCSQMPKKKNHQLHPKHELTLHSVPAYPDGIFKCNACGENGTGFCYCCEDCDVDLHTLCAYMPPSINTNTHHHTLQLCCSPPYQKKIFLCDICKGNGSNHGLYHCDICNFDAHLNCAVANSQPNSASKIVQQRNLQQQHPQLIRSPSAPSQSMHSNPTMHPFSSQTLMNPAQQLWSPTPEAGILFPMVGSSSICNPFVQMNGHASGLPVIVVPQYLPQRTGSLSDNFAGLLMKECINGISQQAGQILLGSIFGGLGGLGGLGGFGFF